MTAMSRDDGDYGDLFQISVISEISGKVLGFQFSDDGDLFQISVITEISGAVLGFQVPDDGDVARSRRLRRLRRFSFGFCTGFTTF
jgi:hypothetical protein